MLRLLCPKRRVNCLVEIVVSELANSGIHGILIDLDNTLMEWGSEDVRDDILVWLTEARSQGLRLCLVSNNYAKRVQKMADKLGIPCVSGASKPRRKGFRDAMERLGLNPEQTAVVGDQLFTDVLGGNRLGLYTIWVTPLTAREFIGTKLTRLLERGVVRMLQNKGWLAHGEVSRHEDH